MLPYEVLDSEEAARMSVAPRPGATLEGFKAGDMRVRGAREQHKANVKPAVARLDCHRNGSVQRPYVTVARDES